MVEKKGAGRRGKREGGKGVRSNRLGFVCLIGLAGGREGERVCTNCDVRLCVEN